MTDELRVIIREELGQILKCKNLDSELLTRKDTAIFLGIKENTLAVWTVRGIGPSPTKIGSCVRYRRSELEKYIQDNTMRR